MISYRILPPNETHKYGSFLKNRKPESLGIFFGYPIKPEQIDSLVAGIVDHPLKHRILVAENTQFDIVGSVHVADMAPTEVEFGLMVHENMRQHGIASYLMGYALEWCRNRGYKKLFLQCLSHNSAIKKLVRKYKLPIESHGGECETNCYLPHADWNSYSGELIKWHTNTILTGLKQLIPS